METTQILNTLNNGSENTDELLKILEEEKIKIAKNIHLIKFTSLRNKLEESINNGLLDKANIKILHLWTETFHKEKGDYLCYAFKDVNERTIDKNDHKEIFDIFDKEFNRFKNLNTKLLGLVHEYNLNIILNQSFNDNLTKSLLSKDLQTNLMYSELQSEISTNNSNNQKLKI